MTNAPIRDLGPLAFALTRIGATLAGKRDAFTGVLFAPGMPLQPVQPEPTPRRWQYPTAYNLTWQPRRDIPGLYPFETLRTLAKRHPLASLCIRRRGEQALALRGGYVAKQKKDQAAAQGDCDALNAWMATPDKEGQLPMGIWLQQLVREVFEVDAPAVYARPARGGGVASLEVIDGATLKPLIDDRGRTVAYQQVLYGLALSQFLGRPVQAGEEQVTGEYEAGEIWYTPFTSSVGSPYGRPAMEDLIELANTYLQKIDFDLKHFTDGNVPAALGVFDGQVLDVDQVAAFEANFNAEVAGDVARGSRIKFIPFPVKIERMAELSTGGRYETAFEERNVRIVSAHYGLNPSELGFTESVNRSTGESQENALYRSMFALLNYLSAAYMNRVPSLFGLPDGYVEWRWETGESEDKLMAANVAASDIAAGVITAAESRAMRYPDLEGPAPMQGGMNGDQAQGAAALAPRADAAADLAGSLSRGAPALVEARKRLGSDVVGVAGREALAKAQDAPDDEAERALAEAALLGVLGGYFAAQLASLRERAENASDGAFWQAERDRLLRAVLPFYQETATAAADAGQALLRIGVDWELVNSDVLALARAEAARLAEQATKTTQAQAAKLVADWIASGGALDDLAEQLSALYPPQRAKMIAATEVTRLYAQGNRAAWRASGVVSGYTIQTARDERVCPVCGPRQGQTYDLEDGENQPPFHPSCRCWIVPKVMSEKEIAGGR